LCRALHVTQPGIARVLPARTVDQPRHGAGLLRPRNEVENEHAQVFAASDGVKVLLQLDARQHAQCVV
jgi:hypothetical protein